MILILLGAPGAGKGTQAATIAQSLEVPHVATGDLFRTAVSQGTELGQLAKSYMDRGELVPDEVTIRMLLERMSQPDCRNGCILDGFPRTLEQAQALDQALADRDTGVDKALYIAVPDAELVRRLSGRWICRTCQAPYHEIENPAQTTGRCDKDGGELYQRDDDKSDTVRNRLQVYFAQTAPLIDYYRRNGNLAEINGGQAIEKVRQDLMAVLE